MDMTTAQGQQKHISTARRHRRSGFTLIEIMVVLVVLLIGILAVVRLFPAGFLGIARTAELTQAGALNQQQLDQQRSMVNQQEAIYADMPGTNVPDSFNILPNTLLDRAAGDASFNGLNLDPWYYSNVNLIRNVMAEAFRIPVPTTNTGVATNNVGYGAIYPLQFGPVENTLNGTTDSIFVYGGSLQRTEQSSVATLNNPTGSASLRNEAEYAIDYDNLKIAFYPRLIDASRPVASRQFTISYDYFYLNTTTGNANLQFQPNASGGGVDPNNTNTVSTIITVPDVAPNPADGSLPAPVWQPLFQSTAGYPMYGSDPNNGNAMQVPMTPPMYMGPAGTPFPPAVNTSFPFGISHESEDVARKFRLALPANTVAGGGLPVWSNNDPYEYAWYSAQNPANTANPGVLIFNPSGHNQTQVNSLGTQPLQARVDYRIFDNHIIRDDRTVPASGPYTVALSLPNLKLGGDVLDNQNPLNNFNSALNPYNGIYRDPANITPDIIIYNANTGQEVGDWTTQNPIGTANPTPGTGVLAVDAALDPTPVNQKTGILTLNPTVVATNNLGSASLRIFYRTQRDWGMQVQKATAHYKETTTPANVDFRHYYIGDGITGSATRIYFAPCDAGKSVMIGECYVTVQAGSTASTGPYRNQTLQITENQQQFDSVGGVSLPYIDITSALTPATGFNAQPTGRRVNNVQGVSVKSRVIWQDTSRWRSFDNDTILVQSPSQ